MPEFTDYQNLELPEPFNVNERNQWGRILNDALDQIDDKLILSGTLTERPPAQTAGRLFLDLESGTLYRDNGLKWVQFGSQMQVQESQSTVAVNPNTLNFDGSFKVTEPSVGTAEIELYDVFIQNSGDTMEGVLDMGSNNLVDGTSTIWNATNGYLEQTALENDSLTLTAGDGLKNGGSVALGSSTTVDIEPADFAGSYLTDDGTDNLQVDIARGLEGDGAGNIRVDEDTDFTFTQTLDFNAGFVTSGDISDGTQVIWDSSLKEIPDGAMGSIDNSTLTNSSLTVTAGDGLKNGGSVSLGGSTTLNIEPTDFAGTFLADDGTDNLTINLGTGVEGDGTGSIRLDEDYAATWTTTQTFSGGIDANTSQITNLPEPTASDHAARKGYVDGVAQGLNLKESVAVSDHDQQIDLTATTDPNPIDGYTLSDGERILLKHQSDATTNGIYVANTATDPSTWTRAPDMDEDSEVTEGVFTFIENGTTHANTAYIITTPDPITLGTTAINWSQFSSAGEITAGNGLAKSGQTLSVNVGAGVELNNDNIRLDEDFAATWTTEQTFGAGIDTGSIVSSTGDVTLSPSNSAIVTIDSANASSARSFTIQENSSTGPNILVANEGGNVSIPNGNLELGNTNITGISSLSLTNGATVTDSTTTVSLTSPDGTESLTATSGTITVPNGDIESGDTTSALELDEQAAVADTTAVKLSRDAQPQGYAMIQDTTNSVSTMVYLGGSAGSVEILHDSGSGDNFSTVEGQQGTTNIYYDSTNSQYELNNETGASATYSLEIMKA